MLRVVAHKSAAAAHQYYAEGLKREDYYSEGQEIIGKWHGKAGALLGLSGEVKPDEFAPLVENRHPVTGERITPRTKADRTVGYDINFHSPKSLSVLHGLTGDDEILKCFRSAVAETMQEIESQIDTRVRKRGAQELRNTGNLIWAEFVHLTARPVGGIPDPHLHSHAFIPNLTFDSVEGRWKAAMFRQIKHDAPYHEAAFHSRLSAKIEALGYPIERTRLGWEVKGFPRTLIEKFSRRTAQIEDLVAEKGITDAKQRDALGARTREGKRRGLSKIDLLAAWGVRLTPEEKTIIAKVHSKAVARSAEKITAKDSVDHAFEKVFEKDSVVQQNRLVAEALKFGVGQISPEQVWRELAKRDMISRRMGDEILCTSLEVLAEEVSLINFVRNGRGKYPSLAPGKTENSALSAEQRTAVHHVLNSHDQVIAIRGAAGVGKTTLMMEVVSQIEASGNRVFAFAPSAGASRGTLREEGFAGAETVAHLLQNKKLQEKIRGKVIWIDEAGMLGTRELWEIMQIAKDSARVIVTGDSGQHAPVARGDGFRQLQRYAGLRIAQVTEIRRQEDEIYKAAVASLSKGDLQGGFRRLDQLGAIVEIQNDEQRYRQLAEDFLNKSRWGVPPLVVSPTHAESAVVTAAIRDAKREIGKIKAERLFTQYHNLQWDLADRKRVENFSPGMLVQFHQNAKGIKRGEMFQVTGQDERGAVRATSAGGKDIALPLKHASRFQVFEKREITLGRGDQIRITRNGKSADGRRLNNGDAFTIGKFTKQGDIVLSSGAILGAKHGHFTYGYCQTSHSSQSKSVRDVLIAQSEKSFVASSREQFYVSVSRGKATVKIYTDDRRGLQQAVGNTSTRTSSIELAGFTKRDIASMSTALDGRQWRDLVQSRKVEGQLRSHVQNLLKERHQNALKKAPSMSWRQYVEMRRSLAGPDGKSRSKGHPAAAQRKAAHARGRSFIRPTELRVKPNAPATEPGKAKAAEPRQKAQPKIERSKNPRQNRLFNAYKSGLAHLDRVKTKFSTMAALQKERAASRIAAARPGSAKTAQNIPQAAKPVKPLPQRSPAQLAKQAMHRPAKKNASAVGKTLQLTKTKPPTPPPPVRRK